MTTISICLIYQSNNRRIGSKNNYELGIYKVKICLLGWWQRGNAMKRLCVWDSSFCESFWKIIFEGNVNLNLSTAFGFSCQCSLKYDAIFWKKYLSVKILFSQNSNSKLYYTDVDDEISQECETLSYRYQRVLRMSSSESRIKKYWHNILRRIMSLRFCNLVRYAMQKELQNIDLQI